MSPPLASLAAAAAFALGLSMALPAARAAEFGDVSVLAQLPSPGGFPEGIAVRNGRVYVAGPATLGTSLNPNPSRVFELDAESGARTLCLRRSDMDFCESPPPASEGWRRAAGLAMMSAGTNPFRGKIPS